MSLTINPSPLPSSLEGFGEWLENGGIMQHSKQVNKEHESGLLYLDHDSDNVAQRDLLETPFYLKDGKDVDSFTGTKSFDEVAVRRLKRGGWRAYGVESVSTYCTRTGGSVHLKVSALHDHSGDFIKAPSLTALLGSLLAGGYGFIGVDKRGKTYKRMIQAHDANRF